MKLIAEVEEESRQEFNKNQLEQTATKITEEQTKSLEDTKAAIERLVRESNLEVDTRFKSRFENLKDQITIDNQNIHKKSVELEKNLNLIQQRVYDIADFKLKDVTATSQQTEQKIAEMQLKLQQFLQTQRVEYEDKLNNVNASVKKLETKLDNMLESYPTAYNSESPTIRQQTIRKAQNKESANRIENPRKSREITPDQIIEEEEIKKKQERRRISVFAVEKDPQKILHRKIQNDIKEHTQMMEQEYKQTFGNKSPTKIKEDPATENDNFSDNALSILKSKGVDLSLKLNKTFDVRQKDTRKDGTPSKILSPSNLPRKSVGEVYKREDSPTRSLEISQVEAERKRQLNSEWEISKGKDKLNETFRTKRSLTSNNQREVITCEMFDPANGENLSTKYDRKMTQLTDSENVPPQFKVHKQVGYK